MDGIDNAGCFVVGVTIITEIMVCTDKFYDSGAIVAGFGIMIWMLLQWCVIISPCKTVPTMNIDLMFAKNITLEDTSAILPLQPIMTVKKKR